MYFVVPAESVLHHGDSVAQGMSLSLRCTLRPSWATIPCGPLPAPSRCELDWNQHRTRFHGGCTIGEALSITLVLPDLRTRWARPAGVADPVELKPSKNELEGRGGQLSASGPKETAWRQLSPSIQMALTTRVQFATCPVWGAATAPGASDLVVDKSVNPRKPEDLTA